jgi:hypothetical protein
VSGTDKAKNKAQDLAVRPRKRSARSPATRAPRMRARAISAKSNLKDAGEKVKDAFKK